MSQIDPNGGFQAAFAVPEHGPEYGQEPVSDPNAAIVQPTDHGDQAGADTSGSSLDQAAIQAAVGKAHDAILDLNNLVGIPEKD